VRQLHCLHIFLSYLLLQHVLYILDVIKKDNGQNCELISVSTTSSSNLPPNFWSWRNIRRYAGAKRYAPTKLSTLKNSALSARRCHTIQVSQAPTLQELTNAQLDYQGLAARNLKRNSSLCSFEHGKYGHFRHGMGFCCMFEVHH